MTGRAQSHGAPVQFIRRDGLSADDKSILLELHALAYATEGAEFLGSAFMDFVGETFHEAELPQVTCSIWFAVCDGEYVGSSALTRRHCYGYLRWVTILPSYRRQGLGRRLVDLAITEAEKARVESITLTTANHLEGALQMYRTLGFDELERSPVALWDVPVEIVKMRKWIAPRSVASVFEERQ